MPEKFSSLPVLNLGGATDFTNLGERTLNYLLLTLIFFTVYWSF